MTKEFEDGEYVLVVDYNDYSMESWQVVHKIDTYVPGANCCADAYLVQQYIMYEDGRQLLVTDVVKSVHMRRTL